MASVVDGAEGLPHGPRGDPQNPVFDGLRVQQIYGAGCSLSKDELNISSVRAATTFCVDLERFVNFEAGKRIYVQCALLYSDPATKRRLVRVHNVALRVVAKPSEHYKTVCVETAFSSLSAECSCFIRSLPRFVYS